MKRSYLCTISLLPTLLSLVLVGFPQSRTIFVCQHSFWELLLIFDILECCLVRVIKHYFIIHQIFKVFLAQRILLEIKIKCTYWISCWLVVWEMELLKIWVGQCLFNCDSVFWVVCEHLLQKINSGWIGSSEELIKIFSFTLG